MLQDVHHVGVGMPAQLMDSLNQMLFVQQDIIVYQVLFLPDLIIPPPVTSVPLVSTAPNSLAVLFHVNPAIMLTLQEVRCVYNALKGFTVILILMLLQ